MVVEFNAWLDLVKLGEDASLEQGWEIQEFLEDHDNVIQFLEAIDDGLTLPVTVAKNIPKDGVLATAAHRFWGTSGEFEADDLFTNTRFQYMTLFWNTHPGEKLWLAARDLFIRMLENGNLEIPYAHYYVDRMIAYHDTEAHAWAAVHDPAVMKNLLMATSLGRVLDTADYLEGVLAATKPIAQKVFMDRWLPAMISDAEHEQAQHLGFSVLRELYAAVYDAGYAGYQQRLALVSSHT